MFTGFESVAAFPFTFRSSVQISVDGICAEADVEISISRKQNAGTCIVFRYFMKLLISLLLLLSCTISSAQIAKGGFKSIQKDTSSYFIRLSSENPFTIDSITSASSGRRLEFYDANKPEKSCSSIVCTETGDVLIGFRELQSMRPLDGESRMKLNSQTQPTNDYQKGVIVFTRHGKKFRRIAINTFMEVPPSDPLILPSVVRPGLSKWSRLQVSLI